MPNIKSRRGFSLVELMVAVTIVGILTAMGVPSYQAMVVKARVGRAMGEMAGIRSAIMGLRNSEDKILMDITGTPSTAAYFQGRNIGSQPVCTTPDGAATQWRMLGYEAYPRDPWFQCYLLDENEGEGGANDCRFDALISGGEDQIWQGSGDGDDVYGDDVILRVPHYAPHADCTGSLTGQFGG